MEWHNTIEKEKFYLHWGCNLAIWRSTLENPRLESAPYAAPTNYALNKGNLVADQSTQTLRHQRQQDR